LKLFYFYEHVSNIRNPILFKLTLGVKDSIEAYHFKLVESRTPNCLNGGVKDSIKIWLSQRL